MTAYRCEYAWLGGDDAEGDIVVTVAGDRISSVEPADRNVAADARSSVTLPGLTIPGMANAHSHAFHRAIRGATQRRRGSFWAWREAMYGVAASLDPDRYRALARATFAEMALAGITTVGEFHYLHHGPGGAPYADPNAMGIALIEAASQAGIRITLLDTCYLHGGIGVEPDETQRRFSDGDAWKWARRVEALSESGAGAGAGAKVGAAVHSVRAVDPDAIGVVAAWAGDRAAPLHAHVSEQPAENDQCVAAHGRTPVELLHERGALGDRFTAVHATHLTTGDVGLLGAARCWCCLCPTTERDLADGIGPSAALVEAGARLTLGSDSHAVVDLLEEARAVELDERLASGRRATHRPPELLRAATEAGQASLGWDDAGRIAPGARADLVTISLDSVRTAGTPGHVLDRALFAATSADVHHVVVAGEVIVRDGTHVRLDVPAELTRSIAPL